MGGLSHPCVEPLLSSGLLPRRIRIVSHNASDKVIVPRLFQIWRHFQVAPVRGRRVLDVHSKQSNFITSTENVNKLCLFVQETEHLQVKLTMMVCPERISNVYNFRRRVHSDSAFRKHELAGRMLLSSCRPEPGKQSLLASAICFNFYWKLRFIWGLRIKRRYLNWINWPDLTQM